MLLRKSEHRRTNPYVAMTIGTLAMVGAFHTVRTTKRAIRCVTDKMRSVTKHSKAADCCDMSE